MAVGLTPLSAKHQYFPESFFLVSKLSVSPVTTVFPSLIHFIVGVGFPVASQWNIAWSASITVLLAGLVIKLGETTIEKYILVKINLKKYQF